MKQLNKISRTSILLISSFLAVDASAQTTDLAARVEALEHYIKILEQKIDAQNEQLTKQNATLISQQEEVKKVVTQNKAKENTVVAKHNSRSLKFESPDGDFALQVGGRLQVDAAFHNADHVDFGDGTAIRRLFLDVQGKVFKDWSYRFQYDFARPTDTDPSSRGIRDAWVQYTGFKNVAITIGSFNEPLGLERAISNLNTTFIERGLTDLFSPDRHIGLGVSTYGSIWTANIGIFGERPEGDVAAEGDEGWDVTGRFTLAPINSDGKLLHLGISGRYHQPENSTTELRFRSRPESNITNIRLIDTGVLANVDHFYSAGLEAAAVYGPFSLQGEYIYTNVDRENDELNFNAWYVYASYFLTGESRPYRAKEGALDRITPNRIVGRDGGGYGAWEIAARYSHADLTDGVIIGGEEDNLTLGINWYATPNLRFSANYIKVLDLDRPNTLLDGENVDIFTLRAQIDF